jgi:HSP20 family protein
VDDFVNRLFGEAAFPRPYAELWVPLVDITETKDTLQISAELPGIEANDLEVSVSGDLLAIKGEKKKEGKHKDEHYHRLERYYGSFQRCFRLPVKVQSDKVDAIFENGILKITLTKIEEAKKKKIGIKVK